MPRIRRCSLATIVAGIELAGRAEAATITWTGGGNNSWHSAANGDLARVPESGDDVVIPYANEEGRTVDVHALRHTKATWMALAGIPIRKAQEEMRHSRIMLTMKVYTDVRLLDDGEAVAALPALSLKCNQANASGTR